LCQQPCDDAGTLALPVMAYSEVEVVGARVVHAPRTTRTDEPVMKTG
jgi:hypothetical protein